MINKVVFFILGVFLLNYNLKFFQQNSYFIKRDFINYYKKNWINLLFILCIAGIEYLLKIPYLSLGLSLFLSLFIGYKIYFLKILKMKYTARMIRLNVVLFPIYFITFYFISIYSLFLLNFILYLSCILLYPIEKKIYNKYIKRLKLTLKDFKGLKIAITGSYGKTSTKHFLATLLQTKYNVFYTELSYNTPMGIAKSVIGHLNNFYDVCILEFGACKKNDIKELMELTDIDISILTGISNQHLNTFKTQENIVAEKFLIIEKLKRNKIGIVNNNSFYVKNYYIKNECKVIYFDNNKNKNNHLYYTNLKIESDYLNFELHYKEEKFDISLNLIGKYNVENFMLCVNCCLILNVDIKEIVYQSRFIKPIKNRVNYRVLNNLRIIDNSFNSNLEGALENIENLKNYKFQKVIITPGLVELGRDMKKSNLQLIDKINKTCDFCMVVNKKNRYLFTTELKIKFKVFNTFKAAYAYLIENFKKDTVCLIENDLPDKY